MISVIVPVYNMEKYLNECLNSIVNQNYKNIEILLVDDGSKDNSLQLCYKWAETDNRIRVFNKENGGQGSARNLALDNIKGEYVSFVDSDDLVTSDMYEILVKLAAETGSDMVICETKTFVDGQKAELNNEACDKRVQMNRFEAMECRMNSGRYMTDSPCNKLYKASLFDNLRFLENRLLEDSAIMYKIIDACEKIAYTNKVGYLIRSNPTSVSRIGYNVRRCDTIITYEEIEQFISSNDRYNSLTGNAQMLANGAVFYNAGEYYRSKINDAKTKKFIKEHAKKQLKSYDRISLKNKVLLFLIANLFGLYGMVYKINRK